MKLNSFDRPMSASEFDGLHWEPQAQFDQKIGELSRLANHCFALGVWTGVGIAMIVGATAWAIIHAIK